MGTLVWKGAQILRKGVPIPSNVEIELFWV